MKIKISQLLLPFLTLLLFVGVTIVYAANSITSPDTTGDVGTRASMALDSSGFPVIAYADKTTPGLKILHCGNANCTSGNSIASPDAVTFADHTHQSLSLKLDASGFPIVAYGDISGNLKVLHCGNANCTSGNNIATIGIGGGNVYSLSMALSGANPVISYMSATAQNMIVLICGNANCSSGNTTTTIESTNVGYFSSVQVDSSGFPVISYRKYVGGPAASVKLVHCGNATCSAGNVINTVDAPADDTGYYTSLVLDSSGFPVISYTYQSGAALKLAHCTDANCAGVNLATVDSTSGVYGYLSSVVLDPSGYPVITYRDAANLDLKVAHCGNANCTSGNTLTTVDSTGDIGSSQNSLKLDSSGFPVVAYYDDTNDDLKVLHCVDVNCAGAPAPTVVTSAATSITNSTAVLNGTSNPNETSATGWFRYHTSSPGTCNDTFGTRTSADVSLGSGSSAVAYSKSITGLTSGTTYYVCAISSNSGGTSVGTVQSFTAAGGGACTSVPTTGNYSLTNNPASATFSYTGAEQTWVVPAGITSIGVDGYGAGVGAGGYSNPSLGGRVQTTLAVTPGETLYIYVGQGRGGDDLTGGFNGGGNATADTGAQSGGAGASDVRQGGNGTANRVIVMGGGGGRAELAGGAGGGTTGGAGSNSAGAPTGGGGGTPSAGGAAGSGGSGGSNGGAGALAQGGNGGAGSGNANGGGGGGGGYYGGGGGGGGQAAVVQGGAGGGGSSYAGTGTSATTHTQGYASATGNGQVVINYTTGGSCVFSNNTFDGVDAGSGTTNTAVLTMPAGYTLTIGVNQTIAFGSISKVGAAFVKFSGGVLKKGPMWIPDTDGDGYPASATSNSQQYSATQPAGYTRRANATLGADCYDSNANAKPGQTAYYSTNRGDGSFDYNCNSVTDYAYSSNDVLSYTTSLSGEDIICVAGGNYIRLASPVSCGSAYTQCPLGPFSSCTYYTDNGCTQNATCSVWNNGGPACPTNTQTCR